MEAFGRLTATLCGVAGVIFCLLFYNTSPVFWQRNETIQSISSAFVQQVLSNKSVSGKEWEAFQQDLDGFGEYCAELTVFERRRYEGEKGRVYLFTAWNQPEYEKEFTEGSYVRLVVKEKERGKLGTFFYGSSCTFFGGGRIA